MAHACELFGLETGAPMGVELCKPREGECCPVTCDAIGSGGVPHVPSGVRSPLAGFPELTCMQLPCGHRFEGTAVIVHFLRSAMQCPLCRAGVGERMDPVRSLRGERWLQTATRSIAMADATEARVPAEDRHMMLLLELLQQEAMEASGVSGVAALYDAQEERPLLVHIALYARADSPFPRIVMPFRMAATVSRGGSGMVEYYLERRYLRELSAAVADFGASCMSVEFIGMHALDRVPMGNIAERLPVTAPRTSHLVEGVNFTIEIRCVQGDFTCFVYYPSPTMLLTLFGAAAHGDDDDVVVVNLSAAVPIIIF